MACGVNTEVSNLLANLRLFPHNCCKNAAQIIAFFLEWGFLLVPITEEGKKLGGVDVARDEAQRMQGLPRYVKAFQAEFFFFFLDSPLLSVD